MATGAASDIGASWAGSRGRFVALAIVALAALLAGCAAQVVDYEPAVLTLNGTVRTEIFYGPPNYGETPDEDRLETAYILTLDRPIDVRADRKPPFNGEALYGIRRVQLVLREFSAVNATMNRPVAVSGTLFRAITGHHRTEVLLTVRSIVASR